MHLVSDTKTPFLGERRRRPPSPVGVQPRKRKQPRPFPSFVVTILLPAIVVLLVSTHAVVVSSASMLVPKSQFCLRSFCRNHFRMKKRHWGLWKQKHILLAPIASSQQQQQQQQQQYNNSEEEEEHLQQTTTQQQSQLNTHTIVQFIRGGDTTNNSDSEDEDDDSEEEEEESEEEESDEESDDEQDEDTTPTTEDDDKATTTTTAISEPITIRIQTNLKNKLLDQSFDLMVVKTRNIGSLKQSIVKQFSSTSKVPVECLQIYHHGILLEDEKTIIQQLLLEEEDEDDDDEDEQQKDDDEEEAIALTLVIDILPPVDNKLTQQQLEHKMMNEVSVSELLDAYLLNEVAIQYTSELLQKQIKKTTTNEEEEEEDEESEEPQQQELLPQQPISFQLREKAAQLRNELETTIFSPEVVEAIRQENNTEQQPTLQKRGQRVIYNPSSGNSNANTGVVVSFRQAVQHNLNIHWADTFRNFILFLFFGYFGGRTSFSKYLLLLCAPLCFIIQARPIKLLYKQILYTLLYHPPSIVLSLLPAPQQAILNCNIIESLYTIYGNQDIIINKEELLILPTEEEEKHNIQQQGGLDNGDTEEEYDDDEEEDSEDVDDDDDEEEEYDEEDADDSDEM